MADTCACGRKIEHPATGRPRQRCEVCSPRKSRGKVVSISAPEVKHERGQRTIADVVRENLERAGRADTADGIAAIYAAEMLAAGGGTMAAAAALLKELRSASAEALKGAQTEESVIDELRRRRANRHAG